MRRCLTMEEKKSSAKQILKDWTASAKGKVFILKRKEVAVKIEVNELFKESLVDHPEHLKATSVGVSFITQDLILEFVEKRLAIKEYKNEKEIQKELEGWQDFAKERKNAGKLPYLPKAYKKMWVCGNNIVAAVNSYPCSDDEAYDSALVVATIHHV